MQNNSSQLSIKNQTEEILVIADWLEKNFDQHNLNVENLHKFDLCANEAVTNIIAYAYNNDGKEHEIKLTFINNSSDITLEIKDKGKPFNPLKKTSSTRPENVENARIGGLGIDLIRHYMDTCSYERLNDTNIFTVSLNK